MAIPALADAWEDRIIYFNGIEMDHDNGIDTRGLEGIVCYKVYR